MVSSCESPRGIFGGITRRGKRSGYAHLVPSYVADTIRAHFPKLGITGESTVKPLRR